MIQKTVYINGRFLTQPATGVQRFAFELLNALNQILEKDPKFTQNSQLVCLLPNNSEVIKLPGWENIRIQKCGKLKGNLWEQVELPFYARRGLLVDLCNIGPIFHFNQDIIFHDASVFAVPQAYSLSFKIKYRVIMWVLGRTARQILTVSQFSKNELAHYLKISREIIAVISEGYEHILNIKTDDSILKKNGLFQPPFLLAVGSSSPHKNLANVIEAVEMNSADQMKLVIAGGSFSKVFKDVKTINSQRILHLGYVTDGELRSLYSQASGFIFPSIYEGFGLPPLEAMACGCPVLCSNRASLPEVCGDAVLYFDPLNVEEMNNSVTQLLENTSLQDELREKGYERVKVFTWKNTAESLLETLVNI